MNIITATQLYEDWIAGFLKLIPEDVDRKHELMRSSSFSFLRATFYRWMQLFPEICQKELSAPEVLSIGDLHLENFGTWRDSEGRLIWGINDFDEVHTLPFSLDLIRLAASVGFAIQESHLTVGFSEACQAIVEGYIECLRKSGRPFVLEEEHPWLRKIALSDARNPTPYWKKLHCLTQSTASPPQEVLDGIRSLLPEDCRLEKIAHRVAGVGSLGRERFVLLAQWEGGSVAREAKSIAPSAALWAKNSKSTDIEGARAVRQAIRCSDPFLIFTNRWVVRRLGPDCSRIDIADIPRKRDELLLLNAMGWETGNIHLGSNNASGIILEYLSSREKGWLEHPASRMIEAIHKDWMKWKQR
jgi:hypothetical protein